MKSFYGFAVTFRHSMEDVGYAPFFFANQMYRDLKFPRSCDCYDDLKRYVNENYRDDIVGGFEDIFRKYQEAKTFHAN